MRVVRYSSLKTSPHTYSNYILDCRWLLVLDNADDLGILQLAWPGRAAGSICLTSRDLTAGHGIAAMGIHVQPFADSTGADAFLRLIGHASSTSELSLAKDICHRLGGLPLALRQISILPKSMPGNRA